MIPTQLAAYEYKNSNRWIADIKTSERRISSSLRRISDVQGQPFHGRCEMDSHADTTVAGKNCAILKYTDRSCDVAPFSEKYTPMKDIPIVTAATGYTSANGRNYILVFNEALYIKDMEHTLINPNQCRHFGTEVQDNPYDRNEAMSIASPDEEFIACLQSTGTIVFLDTWHPNQNDLESYPHIELTSRHHWDPHQIQFPQTKYVAQEEIEGRNISTISMCFTGEVSGGEGDIRNSEEVIVHDMDGFNRRILSSVRVTGESALRDNLLEKKRKREVAATVRGIDMIDHKRAATMAARIVADIMSEKPKSLGNEGAQEETVQDIELPKTFLSTNRHSSTTAEDLSERWSLSLAQAAMTLKATTQKLTRSALMPLARRYRADRMFDVRRLHGTMSTDTMDARCKSLHGDKFSQIFGNKQFFVEAYPIKKKSDCHEGLDKFIKEYGAPDKMIYDGAPEQVGKKTEFQRIMRKYEVKGHAAEAHRSNQNPVEGCIRELRRRWFRTMFRTYCPRALWCYGLPYVAKIMQITASFAADLQGRTPLEALTGETPDISQYLDFGFYDRVWFKEDAGLGETKLGRFLGVSHTVGSLMSYWVLPVSGVPIARTTVQRITNLEAQTAQCKRRFDAYDKHIAERFNEEFITPNLAECEWDKPKMETWEALAGDDEIFYEEFARVITNEDVPEADDEFDPEAFDSYVNMELALDRQDEGPEFARVTKRLKDKDGLPIGIASENPILDTRMYEVEYADGYKAAMTANAIASNLFAQVDQDGNRFVLFDEIIDIRTDGTQIQKDDAFIHMSNGNKRRRETTKGWEVCIQWKDGSSTWNQVKDVKESYPVQLAEYAVQNKIGNEPAFAWWIKYVLKKRDRIISKTASKYWQKTHKYGVRIPKTVKDAIAIDKENGDTRWWEAILQEMANVRPAFELFEGSKEDLPIGYQQIKCHMIFDIKLGENFRRKARLVGGGHMTTAPTSITYSSVVSRDSVRIALTVAALNGLDILACDIQNAYLTAKCREKIWTIAGPEFGGEQGSMMLVKMALYGLKSSGAAFRSKLAGVLYDLQYTPTKADPDVWIRPAVKVDGSEYYEMVLCYVDDVLAISTHPMKTIDGIKGVFKLKGDKAEPPDMYLGASLQKVETADGTSCWSMSSEKYVRAAVDNLEARLAKSNCRLPSKCDTPMTTAYHPAEDVTKEMNAEGIQTYQELIGILRWAVEIGRIDILLEVSLLSSQLAIPRIGHLQAVYRVFGYLKQVPKRRLYFDPQKPSISEDRFHRFDWEDFYQDAREPIPMNMPRPRGLSMSTHCFVDANHAGDKTTRRSMTGILIFCNRAPIIWHSKRQNGVETSTFGSEFTAMKNAVELIGALRYKLRMFGVPMDGPTDMFCDNEAVYKNASMPESQLRKKHHSIAYHMSREAVAGGACRIAKEDTETNLADLFTKVLPKARREFLLNLFTY